MLDLSNTKKYDLIIYEDIEKSSEACDYRKFPDYFQLDKINPSLDHIYENNILLIGKESSALNVNNVYKVSKNIYIERQENKISAILIKLDEILESL